MKVKNDIKMRQLVLDRLQNFLQENNCRRNCPICFEWSSSEANEIIKWLNNILRNSWKWFMKTWPLKMNKKKHICDYTSIIKIWKWSISFKTDFTCCVQCLYVFSGGYDIYSKIRTFLLKDFPRVFCLQFCWVIGQISKSLQELWQHTRAMVD